MNSPIHKTATAGRKTVAFGLPWFAVAAEEKPRKAAASLARRASRPYDLCVSRTGEFQQYALASTAEGAKSGSISAASVVAEMAGMESWLYVMELGDDVWICSVRDGYILPDGDIVHAGFDEAQEAFRKHAPETFKRVLLPPSWLAERQTSVLEGVEADVGQTDLAHFLDHDLPKWGRISTLSAAPTIFKGVAALGILAGGGLLAFMVFGPADGLTDEEIRARMRLVEQREAAAQAEAYAQLDNYHPWASEPYAQDVLEDCLAGIGNMPSRPVGYRLEGINCSGSIVEASAERTTGHSSWLLEWAAGHEGLFAATDPTGASAVYSRDLDSRSTRADHPLRSGDDFDAVSRAIFQHGQVEGAGVQVNPPTVTTNEEYPEYVPKFATSTFSIETTRPQVWPDLFQDFSGLVLDNVSYSAEAQTYTMEGKLYVPNF